MAKGGKRGATGQEKAARGKPAAVVAPDAWPAWSVERRRIGELRDHPNNVRTHPVGQLKQLDHSFAEHGAVRPLVINESGQILAGHGSRDSLLHLHGDVEVPVVVARGWSEAQQRAFMLRDNATAELSGWDKLRLGLELVSLKSLGLPDLATLGLKPATIDRLTGVREGSAKNSALLPPATAEMTAAAAPALVVSRPGDIWLLDQDCITVSAMSLDARCAIDVMIAAWEQFTKKSAVLAAGGLSFDAVAAARAAEHAAAKTAPQSAAA